MRNRIVVALAVATLGCSEDSGGTNNDAGNAIDAKVNPIVDGGALDADNTDAGMPPNCSPSTLNLVMTGAFEATSGSVVPIRESGKLIGFEATMGNDTLWLLRDGDFSDGDFESVQTYDVSAYPYNLNYIRATTGTDCGEGFGNSCKGFHATGGTLTVTATTPSPVFMAHFQISGLFTDSTKSEPVAGNVLGCLAVPLL
jgi:hypothetical protein